MKPVFGRLAPLLGSAAAVLVAISGCGGSSELEYYSSAAGQAPSSGGRANGGGTGGTGGTAMAGAGDAPSGGTGSGGTGGTESGGTGGAESGGTGGVSTGGSAGTGGIVEPPDECGSDLDCQMSGLVCDPLPGACVECLFDTDCDQGERCLDRVCDPAIGCTGSVDCEASSTPVCDVDRGHCVECLAAGDCAAPGDCVAGRCEPYDLCRNSRDCPADTVCDRGLGRCVTCVVDGDCGQGWHCVASTCKAGCATDGDCPGAGEVCDRNLGVCFECLQHSDCPSVYFCDGGTCALDVCTSGTSHCTSNELVRCRAEGDGYDRESCLDRRTCVDDGGAYCSDWLCTPGTTECDLAAERIITCSDDGLTVTGEVDCAAQGEICVMASCVDLRCVPSATYCEGETIRQCASDGLSSSLVENCSTSEFCDDSSLSCLPQVCAPNQAFCNGDRAQVCNDRGSGAVAAGVDCASNAGMRCLNGACACQSNRLDCDDSVSTGCEIYGSSDVDNCGSCGSVCSSNHVPTRNCSASTCNGACESGYSDCNADKGTDGCETYVNGDTQNCGGCGRVCSSNHVSVSCTSASCDGSCSSGYADCNGNKQTDGCETDTLSSANACGGCGQTCSSNHMQTRTCGGGACNGTCAAGFDDCNGNKFTDGCEVDLRFDEQNCGGCGQQCAAGDTCVSGVCQACNDTVLLLGDGSSANVTLETLLENAGMVVTLVNPGISAFYATPNPSEFGAVAMPIGNAYSGMPNVGQQAIVAAHAAGTGVVFTEWASYSAVYYWRGGLESLVLSTFAYVSAQAVTYTLTSAGHPIWDGLPTTFTTTETPSHSAATPINGGTKIADCVQCSGAGVIVRDNGGGRIVNITHSANYEDEGWVQDPYLGPLFVNSVRWATGCF